MLTVDYIDNEHLLVTFGVSKLMQRLPDCPSDDEDRIVRAVLLELPSGRELAHTEWRFHDLGQYLWNVGDGQFMLRKRDVLTVFSPVQDLASGNPFAEKPFLRFDRRIEAIIVSASRDLLTVETIKRTPPKPPDTLLTQAVSQSSSQSSNQSNGQSSQSPSQPVTRNTGLQRRDPNELKPDTTPIEVNFIRILRVPVDSQIHSGEDPAKTPSSAPTPVRLIGRLDGRIYTSTAVNVPVTTEGFIRAKAATRDGVLLDFLGFSGKDIDLGDFPTSCPPKPSFVSPSEFVAFGCRGSEQSLDLAGFNLRGDFLWQINFSDEQAYPSFASSISAGRFAFSRTVTSTHVFGNETPSVDQLQAQEVRVIQMYNGKQLLRVVTSPIQRAGQNFTLSPDGLELAVIHDNPAFKSGVVTHQTSIEIYKLPPLSGKDQSQVKLEAAMAPESSNSHMRFSLTEIKDALAAKQVIDDSNPDSLSNAHATLPSDSRIVGDPVVSPAASPATSTTGTIPSSDTAPACATLTEASSASANACPVKPQPKADTQDPATDSEDPPTKRRKPPTLYDPAPANPPSF